MSSEVARDPAAALAAIQAAAMNEDGDPVQRVDLATEHVPMTPAPTFTEAPHAEPQHDLDDDHTLPPPDADELLGDVGPGAGGALVEAKICVDGHPNPPLVARCELCGSLLSPGPATIVTIPRPSLGTLRLDDDTTVELDEELLLGRNPARDDDPTRTGLRRVLVPGDKVSRRHLEVRYRGWDVVLTDCGSTNGTFVVPHPGGPVVALDPQRPQLVEPGAVVYFGSRSFTVVGRSG